MGEFLLPLGEIKGCIDFVDVRIYDRDRTICDVLRKLSKSGEEDILILKGGSAMELKSGQITKIKFI